MAERERRQRRQLYARVRALHSAQYRDLDPHRWYKLSPTGISPDGRFWIVDYGVKIYASKQHFEVIDRIPDPFSAP